MKIRNIEGLSAQDLQQEEANGSRFVYYQYTISLLVVTFRRTSDVYLLRPGKQMGTRFTILSTLFGWWGIPYGPKYTLEAIRTNLRGGKDVTDEVMQTVAGHLIFTEAEQSRRTQTAGQH